ncbi:MAG TPA: hypothetical protein EYP90_08340 [Chromatiaceae bacterium]|nr:hypothetical protein [Chromatiaceae bacterium]
MKTAAKMLKKYGQRYLGGKIGFTAVLHTWGQTMQAHLHVHFMVSGGALALTEAGARWQPAKKKFLFPAKKLSRDFRQAFCVGLRKLDKKGVLDWDKTTTGMNIEAMLGQAMKQRWEVYIEPPPANESNNRPETLAEYLSRYIHSIAIGN